MENVKYFREGDHGLEIKTAGSGITPKNGKILWHLQEQGLSKDMDKYKIIFAISEGFRRWQQHFPQQLEATGDINEAAIIIKFRTNENRDLPIKFKPGVLAYAFFPSGESKGLPSDVFLNDGYNWGEMHKAGQIFLLKVFIHELGHSFGLHHSDIKEDILYWQYQPNNEINITDDTILGIQKLYGEVKTAEPEPKTNTLLEQVYAVRGQKFLEDLIEDELIIIASSLGIDAHKEDLKADTVQKIVSRLTI